jgi:hypothetical protein
MLSFSGLGWRQTNMKRIFLAAELLAGFLGAPAFAQTKVGDWDIEKRAQDEHCNASRAYKDSDADQNVIVLTYSKDAIVLVLIYEAGNGPRTTRYSKPISATTKPPSLRRPNGR